MQFEFTAFPRRDVGRGGSHRVRRSGKTPGIVYGGSEAPTPIELDHNALFHALRNEAFHSSILMMKLDGTAQKVLLRDVQMHPVREQVLHVDFQRVDENRKIHMKVPLHFANQENSPAVKLSHALVTHVMNELDVACLPRDLPEFITVDLGSLEAGHTLRVSGLSLPAGVSAAATGREDPVVATAVLPKSAEEEVVAETAAAATPAAEVPKSEQKGKGETAEKAPAKKEGKK